MTAPVLLLNASFEPLRTISFQRAMTLIVDNRAELVSAIEGKFVRSPSLSFPWPSVVRLINYVKIPFRKTRIPATKKNVLSRDYYACCYCTKRKAESVDHVMPKSRGGEHSWMNLVASCKKCNSRKDDRTPKEAGMKMRFQPFVPQNEKWLIVGLARNADWSDYLPA